jgi:hypothetical protein
VQVTACGGYPGNCWRDELTESSKPEMRRFDAAGQVEEVVH